MTDNPILSELRDVQRAMFADCGGDVQVLREQLREQSASHPERMVSLEVVRRNRHADGPLTASPRPPVVDEIPFSVVHPGIRHDAEDPIVAEVRRVRRQLWEQGEGRTSRSSGGSTRPAVAVPLDCLPAVRP